MKQQTEKLVEVHTALCEFIISATKIGASSSAVQA